MNTLAIICGSLARGGAERVTIHLADYIAKQGKKVFIITENRWANEYEEPKGVERICLSEKHKRINGKVAYLSSIKALNSVIREKKIDTVLIMGVPICVYAIPGCFGTNVKIVVSERNDPKHFAGKNITKVLSRYLMRKADGYVFQTEEAQEFYKNKLKSNGVVIPNPLIIDGLPDPYTGVREKTIVTAGRLIEQKNHKLLIEAFSKISDDFPDYNLVIYGEGNMREELERDVDNKGLSSRILFPGNIGDLHNKIKKATLFVLTSNFEGMPNALIEAMALGIPCISTDCPCGGPRALIENAVNGYLIPVGDEKALCNCFTNVLTKGNSNDITMRAVEIRNSLHINVIGKKWVDYINSL